jgi:cytochrome d ubiquinol oxidase subunit II
METLWFCLVAIMLTAYVVLDGFDLGAGILHFFIARTDSERSKVIRSLGPVWDGNEVWLLAAGGSLFCAFPDLYATAFSGFYLPLMIVLWLLTGRALGIEFRHQIRSPLWIPVWDVIFSLSSTVLALFYGVALGNVVRGVPLDTEGSFFEPLWTDFSPYHATGILDGYTVLAGLTVVAALMHHGSLWVALKTEGPLRERSKKAGDLVWWILLALIPLLTLWTFNVQGQISSQFSHHPWGLLFPLLAVAGFVLANEFRRRDKELEAFLASSGFLAGMMCSMAFGLYPYVLPASTVISRGLTVTGAASSEQGLGVALKWWIPGMALVAVYFVFLYRKFLGKVPAEGEGY